MTSIFVANMSASVAFSPALAQSCMSLAFWKSNQRPYRVDCGTGVPCHHSNTWGRIHHSYCFLCVQRYAARHCVWTRLHRALLCCLRCVFCLWPACYVFTNTPLVVHPFICTSYHIHNDVINHLNNVILLARENLHQVPCHGSDIDFDQWRKTQIPRDYQGTSACTLEAAAVQCSLAELPCGPLLIKDILLRKMHTGVRATVFTHDAVQLNAILKMHGFSHVSNTIHECKIMLLQHLLNGDCMSYDHLCHTSTNTLWPDRTACQALSNGFSNEEDFVHCLIDIVTHATAQQITVDDLLVMGESIGEHQLDCPRVNLRRQLLQTLKGHCVHKSYRAMRNTPAFDVFHDLLCGFKQCNAATLLSIMAHHRISPPSNIRLKHDNMITTILTHISKGHCIVNSHQGMNDPPNQQSAPADDQQTGCEDVHHVIDPHLISQTTSAKVRTGYISIHTYIE